MYTLIHCMNEPYTISFPKLNLRDDEIYKINIHNIIFCLIPQITIIQIKKLLASLKHTFIKPFKKQLHNHYSHMEIFC